MQLLPAFESCTLSRKDWTEKSEAFREMQSLIENSEIKIVDMKRNKDELTVVFRRLQGRQ